MKKIIKPVACFIFFLAVSPIAFGQTNFTQTLTYHVDEKGSAGVEMTQKMNAQQWQTFKANVNASNMAVKKRDIERMLPMLVLRNFKYSEDEMERTSKFTFDVDGFAEYTGDNKWAIKLESKKPQIEKLSDNAYMLTSSMATIDGGVFQQIHKVYFPAKASGVEVNKDAFGMAKLDYNLKSEKGGMPLMLIGGGILTLAGAGLFFVQKKKPS